MRATTSLGAAVRTARCRATPRHRRRVAVARDASAAATKTKRISNPEAADAGRRAPAEPVEASRARVKLPFGDDGAIDIVVVKLPSGDMDVTFSLVGAACAANAQGAGVELHWATTATEGDVGAWRAPAATIACDGVTREFGDGIAKRSVFDKATNALVMRVPASEEDVGSIVGICVSGDFWAHATDGDVRATIKRLSLAGGAGGGLEALARRATDLEGGSVNLFTRFCAVDGALDDAAALGGAGAAVVYSWLRLSSLKQLHWYAGNNYQGKDMASMQERLAGRIAHKAATAEDPTARGLMRASLAFLPRGGGNGDDIRMGILNIMRQHGIKEGHRPGIEDPFIAQWHQKLHSNTTPDDVKICEAYLHFLHTGNWDDFWEHLWTNARLTREDLAGMKAGWRSDGITGPAYHMPHMIDSFKHYLWILKTTHGGGDVDSAMNFARHGLPGDVAWEVDDMLQNRDAWWVPGKIVEIREKMLHVWQNDAPNRDVVMLDATLEKFFRTKVESVDHAAMSADDLLGLLELSLKNATLTQDSPKLSMALSYLRAAMGEANGARWSESWAKTMDAALEYCALAMEHDMDFLCSATQSAANIIAAKSTKTDPKYLINFGEENVRSHVVFVVSQLISSLRPTVRAAAGRSPWLIASVGDAALETYAGVAKIETLGEIQGEDFSSTPMVCFTEKLGGLEDIPAGVKAVVTKSPVDLLSHIAIRARNTNVLLASVADDALWANVVAMNGEHVRCAIVDEALVIEKANVSSAATTSAMASALASASASTTKVSIKPYTPSESWVITPDAYVESIVGGKSKSLAEMAKELAASGAAAGVDVPGSFALPFGAFERALAEDTETRAQLDAAVRAIDSSTTASERRDALAHAREIIATQLVCPSGLEAPLTRAAKTLNADADMERVWDAVCGVWASKWTERAWLSRKACGIPDADLNVAVLLMELVDAEYAFVLHTANPVTGDADEVFGELCVGLGETLVGNDPGCALGFTVSKSTGEITIRSVPSKLQGHFAPAGGTIIARSDSNGEDLEDFAGAGLYDSITAEATEERVIDYASSALVWDAAKRDGLITRIAEAAKAIESYRGAPQDIEGAVVGDRIVLLQTRAQIC